MLRAVDLLLHGRLAKNKRNGAVLAVIVWFRIDVINHFGVTMKPAASAKSID